MHKQYAITLGALIMLISCSSNSLDYYQNTSPRVDLKEYFQGSIKAWGLIQDWRGRVISRFDVDMVGTWVDNIGTLKEDFSYYSGEKNQRIWTITKQQNNTYQGTAPDIIDTATGKTQGSAIRWQYVMDVPVDNKTYRIRFDDWMWLMHDGVIINRSYLKKFGFTVAELTLFMQKQPL